MEYKGRNQTDVVLTERLRELVHNSFGIAKGIIEDGEEAIPVFVVLNDRRQLDIIGARFDGEVSKAATFETVRRYLREHSEAVAYCFVCEAWRRVVPKAEEWDGRPPSECADRIDTLMADGWSRSGDHFDLVADIVTDKTGARSVTVPKSLHSEPGAQMTGRAANLFFPVTVGGVS